MTAVSVNAALVATDPFEQVRCDIVLRIEGVGGKESQSAVFTNGDWTSGSGTKNSGSLDLNWFVDTFGSDRIRATDSRTGSFSYTKLFIDQAVPFDYRLTLRFRMPDGSLEPKPATLHCAV